MRRKKIFAMFVLCILLLGVISFFVEAAQATKKIKEDGSSKESKNILSVFGLNLNQVADKSSELVQKGVVNYLNQNKYTKPFVPLYSFLFNKAIPFVDNLFKSIIYFFGANVLGLIIGTLVFSLVLQVTIGLIPIIGSKISTITTILFYIKNHFDLPSANQFNLTSLNGWVWFMGCMFFVIILSHILTKRFYEKIKNIVFWPFNFIKNLITGEKESRDKLNKILSFIFRWSGIKNIIDKISESAEENRKKHLLAAATISRFKEEPTYILMLNLYKAYKEELHKKEETMEVVKNLEDILKEKLEKSLNLKAKEIEIIVNMLKFLGEHKKTLDLEITNKEVKENDNKRAN